MNFYYIFKGHRTAAIMEELKMETKATIIDHPQSLQWLEDKATFVVSHVDALNQYRSSIWDA